MSKLLGRAHAAHAQAKVPTDDYFRSGAILGALLGFQAITITQVLAQTSAERPSATPPTIQLDQIDPNGCTEIPPFVHCDVVTPQGHVILKIPQDKIDSLIDSLSKMRPK
jgi:hypothetical protein